jgi:hypothetical protein
MVLMSTKLLPSDDELVSDLDTHHQDYDLLALRIIQDTKVACPEFVLGHGIRTEALDGTGERRRLVLQARTDRRLQSPLFTRREELELPLRVLADRDPEWHVSKSAKCFLEICSAPNATGPLGRHGFLALSARAHPGHRIERCMPKDAVHEFLREKHFCSYCRTPC